MIGRPWLVGAGAVCVAMIAVVPVAAQQSAVEQAMKASAASVYTPPACVPGVPFADVTCSTGFDPWIEQFGLDGITAGCGGGNYCPGSPVTRDQMAVFVEKAMRGTSNWPPHTVLVFHHPAAEVDSDLNSGTELLAMVAAVPSTGSEAPSASNPWLVKVGPGIFDLGSGSLALPAYTALEGGGQEITVIAAAGHSAGTLGTVIVGDHGTLSRLTVNNSGDNINPAAVYLPSGATNVGLEHVTLVVYYPSGAGTWYGLDADTTTSFSLVDCEINIQGGGYLYGIAAGSSAGESRLDGGSVTASGGAESNGSFGFYGDGANPVITNSRFSVGSLGSQRAIYVTGGGTLDLRNSELNAGNPAVGFGVVIEGVSATLQGDLIASAATAILTSGSGFSADISECNFSATAWVQNGTGYTVTVGASKLIGTTLNAGTVNCFGNYTGSAFLASTCP